MSTGRPSWTTRLSLGCHRGLGGVRQARSRWHERGVARRFRTFQEGLEERRDAIYMFFTGGLLHWAARAASFVPEEVNLVLVGAGLSDEEGDWLRARVARPFHRIGPRVDDNTVLELLFETAVHDFGWLHIDCFVLDPALFQEMTALPDGAAMNCVWTQPGGEGAVDTLHSAFVFLSHRVLREVRDRLAVHPTAYHYRGTAAGRRSARHPLYSRVPTARQVELLARVLAPGPDGLPAYPRGTDYFQVLVLYQLVAHALGYPARQVRPLTRGGGGSVELHSDEVLHVNLVTSYRRFRGSHDPREQQVYQLLLQADWAMLDAMGPRMPESYGPLRRELASELERLDLAPAAVRPSLERYLGRQGIGPETAARILGGA